MDHATQRPLRLHWPDGAPGSSRRSPGNRAGCEPDTAGSRRCAPPGMEVVLVAVGDHDPGEAGEDPGVGHEVQAAGAQPERRVQLGECAVHVLLLPGRPGPQRRLVEPRHRGGGDQGADQPHHVRGQGCRRRQAGMDEPIGHGSAGDVGDQLAAPLHRNMLEDDQVNRQGPQPRPIDSAESGTPAGRAAASPGRRRTWPRAGRAAPAPPPRPGSPPADTTGQPPGQRHRPGHGRTSTRPRDGDPRSGPGPATSWTPPGCPAASALLLPRPLSSPPLLPRRLPARQIVRARRHRGIPAVPRPRALRRLQLLPKARDRRLQRSDLPGLRRDQLRLLPDQRITRILRRIPGHHIGHNPQSSRKPHSPTTATPRPTLERNPRLLAATPNPGA